MTLTSSLSSQLSIVHNRSFGIEVECFGCTMEVAKSAIEAAGIGINIEGYNHQLRSDWKIVTDASVNNGFEVVSPILSGNDGLNQVRKVARALISVGARVDKRCGFHVHVDARDLSGADLAHCVRRYAAHENQIDTFMPNSRRGTLNSYCRSMTPVVDVLEGTIPSASARAVAGRVHDRFYKLNLCAYLRHSTIEFRQHSGTVDARKMVNWIIFCVTFVEDSRTQVVVDTPVATPTVSVRRNSIESKFLKLAQIMDQHDNRSNPVTAALLATALEVDEASVPSYVSQFRTRYPAAAIQARRGRGYYRDCSQTLQSIMARGNAAAPVGRVVIPQDLGIFGTLAPEVVSYFQERAVDLAA
jgi:hypothetical protein